MSRINVPCCLHVDWPCCGCNEEILTGKDAIDIEEEDMYDESLDGDHKSASAPSVFGIDEEYGPCSMSAWDDQFEIDY